MSLFRQVIITTLFAVAIFFGLQATIQSSVVAGSSMEPSLEEGDRLIINKLIYKFGEPERGDIVVFEPPIGMHVDFIKRIIALPNDTVAVREGIVYVNGSSLEEPYIASPPKYNLSQQEVPEDYYFVLGDNRNNSNDSHSGWLLPRENIVGKACLYIWPLDRLGTIPNYALTPD